MTGCCCTRVKHRSKRHTHVTARYSLAHGVALQSSLHPCPQRPHPSTHFNIQVLPRLEIHDVNIEVIFCRLGEQLAQLKHLAGGWKQGRFLSVSVEEHRVALLGAGSRWTCKARRVLNSAFLCWHVQVGSHRCCLLVLCTAGGLVAVRIITVACSPPTHDCGALSLDQLELLFRVQSRSAHGH